MRTTLATTLLLFILCAPSVEAQPGGMGGGGPPGGMGGGGPPAGMGGGARADSTTPGGVNIPCDDPSAGQECLACTLNETPDDPLSDTRRRRYEIRDMPQEEWETFTFAMQEIKIKTMEEGTALYGPLFKTHDYLVTLHAVAAKSARGDQGHFGSQFLSFHTALCLALEVVLLRVAEVAGRPLSGIPYYWMLNSSASDVLTANYYGTHPGLGDGYEITDGPFAFWPITADFDINDYSEFITDMSDNGFVGNNGRLRSATNMSPNFFNIAFPSISQDLGVEIPYQGADLATAMECINTPYDPSTYTIFNFTVCIDNFAGENWHSGMHASIGGRASPDHAKYDAATMTDAEGDLLDVDTSPNNPIFTTFHATLDMFMREWASRSPEGAATQWGLPYAESYNFQTGSAYPGINGNDVITSTWPFTWADMGWADPGTTEGSQFVTHAQAYCFLSKENAPYIYVQYSEAPETAPGVPLLRTVEEENPNMITGTIYCDNYFEFYFNGELIASDPMTFIPHQAVEVSFEWDGLSDKEYAIMCQDFATDSGYEYTETTNPGLGDGALIAAFSDGTRTTAADWKSYVVTYGPTEESEAAGCSATNLDVCVVENRGEPADWFSVGFDFSDWDGVTEYTSDEAGWGRTPTWINGFGCCTSISPLTQDTLTTNNGCSINYDLDTRTEFTVDATESECQNPRDHFDVGGEYSDATFIWGSSLTKDNRMLFRLTVPVAGACGTGFFDFGIGCICFSGKSIVETDIKGTIAMRDLEIGDRVKVASGEFEQVYSFGHQSHGGSHKYLSINSELEISDDHMVALKSGGFAPGSSIKIGDTLVSGDGSNVQVKSIKFVRSEGMYAPFTKSGTIVVNGIVASSFVSMQGSPDLSVAGISTGVTWQWMAHSFELPHRLACHYFGRCLNEQYTEEGLSTWIAAPYSFAVWLMNQHALVLAALMVPMLALLSMFALVDLVLSFPLATMVVVATAMSFRRSQGIKIVQ